MPGTGSSILVLVESSRPLIEDTILVITQAKIALLEGRRSIILGVRVTVLWLMSLNQGLMEKLSCRLCIAFMGSKERADLRGTCLASGIPSASEPRVFPVTPQS